MNELVAAAIIAIPIGFALGWYYRGAANEGGRPQASMPTILTSENVPKDEVWLVNIPDERLIQKFKLGGLKP